MNMQYCQQPHIFRNNKKIKHVVSKLLNYCKVTVNVNEYFRIFNLCRFKYY